MQNNTNYHLSPTKDSKQNERRTLSFLWHDGASWTTDLLLKIQGKIPGAFERCFVCKVLCRGKLGLGEVVSAMVKVLSCRPLCCEEAAHLFGHRWLGRVSDNQEGWLITSLRVPHTELQVRNLPRHCQRPLIPNHAVLAGKKIPDLCHHPLLLLQERDCYVSHQILLQVMFVSLIAVSNTCADGLHASELNTEFLELSGLVCCATGYHHIIQSCLESTEKPQLCLEAWIWVCASSQQSSGRLVFTSGERCLVVRTCSHHAASWAASPQAPFPQCMGTLKPSTSLYSDTIILHLKALICGPGLKIYVAALCIFLFLWRKRNKDGKKKTNPR